MGDRAGVKVTGSVGRGAILKIAVKQPRRVQTAASAKNKYQANDVQNSDGAKIARIVVSMFGSRIQAKRILREKIDASTFFLTPAWMGTLLQPHRRNKAMSLSLTSKVSTPHSHCNWSISAQGRRRVDTWLNGPPSPSSLDNRMHCTMHDCFSRRQSAFLLAADNTPRLYSVNA